MVSAKLYNESRRLSIDLDNLKYISMLRNKNTDASIRASFQ